MESRYLVPSVAVAFSALLVTTNTVAGPDAGEASAQPPIDDRRDKSVRYNAVWKKWQKEIAHFDAKLRKLVEEANIPGEEEFKRRLESESGWVEVITDGYGGVVDFNAAKGTIQHEANMLIGRGGPYIDWEFELAGDTRINYDQSTRFVPKVARITREGEEEGEQFRFFISLARAGDGTFKAGDRIRLRASIDDFSRFKKRYGKATGLVALYYLEGSPNPVFDLRLDEAKITLIEPNNGEQDGADQPATAPASKLEGDSKPQPKSEARSQ